MLFKVQRLMCIYSVLDPNEQTWKTLCEFIMGKDSKSYIVEITGCESTGYRFHYISSTTNYLSGIYATRDTAIDGLYQALLRSLVLNTSLSVLVSDNTDKIVFQSETNIDRFGLLKGEHSHLINEKALWVSQRAFGETFTVYREVIEKLGDRSCFDPNR